MSNIIPEYMTVFLNPGDKVFYVYHNNKIVVPATVVSTINYIITNDNRWGAIYNYIDGSKSCTLIRDNKTSIYEEYPAVSDYKISSQFIWIDEPIGHELALGDDVFIKLHEAISVVRPSNKKNLKIRLKQSRSSNINYIKSRNIKFGDEVKFPKYIDKKIYVRRKR